MKISAKIDYACHAILELALHWPNTVPMQINVIAKRQNIPINFLTHILINLKQLGYVDSIRGKSGGYLLRNAPKEIRLSDVVSDLGGWGSLSAQNHRTHPNKRRHVLDAIWTELEDTVSKQLAGVNFETICDRARKQDQALIFEI